MIWCDYITHRQSGTGIQKTLSHPSSANKYDEILYLGLCSTFFLGSEIRRLLPKILGKEIWKSRMLLSKNFLFIIIHNHIHAILIFMYLCIRTIIVTWKAYYAYLVISLGMQIFPTAILVPSSRQAYWIP